MLRRGCGHLAAASLLRKLPLPGHIQRGRAGKVDTAALSSVLRCSACVGVAAAREGSRRLAAASRTLAPARQSQRRAGRGGAAPQLARISMACGASHAAGCLALPVEHRLVGAERLQRRWRAGRRRLLGGGVCGGGEHGCAGCVGRCGSRPAGTASAARVIAGWMHGPGEARKEALRSETAERRAP